MSTRGRTWKVLDYGDVPIDAQTVPFEADCGHEAELPVVGRVIAMTSGGGIIFDIGEQAIPNKIKCRRCGRVFATDSFIKQLDSIASPMLSIPTQKPTKAGI